MVFFRKNKRQFAYRSHRRVFVALFLVGVLGVSGVITFILNANAQLVPVKSVEIFSNNSSYDDNNQGAWKVTKSAEWIDTGKARITLQVDSITKIDDSRKLDVIIVADNSGSMEGEKLDQVKADAADLTDAILADEENRVALVTFAEDAYVVSGLTNDKDAMISHINAITTRDTTNYYQGLKKAETILQGYQHQDGRELIMLFLTDGYPNEETPNEMAEYECLKTMYPYMTINGIQYEMGAEILQPIINISDYQYIANINTLNNVLFEAISGDYFYDEFKVTDYINSTYWSVNGVEGINTSIGTYSLDIDGDTPVVTWDLSGIYRSGKTATLTIDVVLKNDYLGAEDLLLPTNTHEVISSKISNIPDENVDSDLTPKLKENYILSYDTNAPTGCEIDAEIPDPTRYSVYSMVELADVSLTCEGYNFKGWQIATPNVYMHNSDYLRMPETDVVVVALWGRPDISKAAEGTVKNRAIATFDTGTNVSAKMKALAGATSNYTCTSDYNIKNIVKSDAFSPSINLNDSNYILSAPDSDIPIYGWYNDGTLYYYSDAETVATNVDASYMFCGMYSLENIDSLIDWDVKNTTNMSEMFAYNQMTSLEPLRYWKVGNVTDMSYMFYATTKLTSLEGIKNWDVSKVTTMAYMFQSYSSVSELTDLDGLRYWNTESLTDVRNIFYGLSKIQNVDGLSNWKMGKVTDFSSMFENCSSLKNLDGMLNWDTSKVTKTTNMFLRNSNLSNIDGLRNWNTGRLNDATYMFGYNYSITSVDALADWNTSNLSVMTCMFYSASALTDLNGLARWNTNNLTSLYCTFGATTNLENIDALANWRTPRLTNLIGTFNGAKKVTNLNALANWDTSKVTNMQGTFQSMPLLTDISALRNWSVASASSLASMFSGDTSLTDISALSNWDTKNVTQINSMFSGANSLSDISPISGWNLAKNTSLSSTFSGTAITNVEALRNWNTSNNTSLYYTFSATKYLTDISAISGWNTSKVTSMYGMFYGSSSLSNISGLSGWDVSKVTNMNYAFASTESLRSTAAFSGWTTTSLTSMLRMFWQSGIENIDGLANWNVSKVTDMSYLFSEAKNLLNIDGALNWNTGNVTDMARMFASASKLDNIDGALNWNTIKVTSMVGMFSGANSLRNIDGAINWKTGLITNTYEMFNCARLLQNINGAANWDMKNVTSMSYMFREANALSNIEGARNWNTAKVTNISYMFNNAYSITDLSPIFGWNTTKMTNKSGAFNGIPSSVTRPSWY